MPLSLFIAKRFLKVRKGPAARQLFSFITAIAIAGITLGVAALLITLTILGGFEKEIREKIIAFTTHIQVTGFQNQPLKNYLDAVRIIPEKIKGVSGISPFVAKEGMVRFGDAVEGIFIKGIDPDRDVTSVKKYLVEGKPIAARPDSLIPGCAVGRKLAVKLHASINDTVFAFVPIGTYYSLQQPRMMPFVVSGIYESGMAEYDDIYFFTNLRAAQELFLLGDVATGFDVMLNRVEDAPEIAQQIMELMGYPYYARTLYQLYRNLFTWIELQKKPTPIILGLIIIVATVNIIGTLLMMVMEKTRHIGVMKSLGASRKVIRNIFLLEGLTVGLTGTILGNILAFLLCWLQQQYGLMKLQSSIYFMSQVPILFRWENFLIVSLISLVLCLAASSIPAHLASRLDPVKSLRYS
jgi:lipoprotein-releasing system permease protein